MESTYFGCERAYIEQIRRVVQRDILIQLYCKDNFSMFNLVDIYYNKISQNAILMFLLIIALYPLLFICLSFIAQKYLSVELQDLAKRLRLSPSLAAVTIIAGVNGSTDILNSTFFTNKIGGEIIAVGTLYGAFLFSSTLVMANVITSSPGVIKLPRYAMIKELAFYLLSVVIIIVFGLIKRIGYTFVAIYFGLYAVYLVISIMVDKYDEQELEEYRFMIEETEDYDMEVNNMEHSVVKRSVKLEVAPSTPTIRDKDADAKNAKKKREPDFFDYFIKETYFEEGKIIETIILMPLSMLSMFTICYDKNPFMNTFMKYVIAAVSVVWFISIMELLPFAAYQLFIVWVLCCVTFIILDLALTSTVILDIIFEIVAIFASIGWLKIFSMIIMDILSFIAFYFNINELILTCLLLSSGNTISDFFTNSALASTGATAMGALASYSSQNFNALIGFAFYALNLPKNHDNFDIFSLKFIALPKNLGKPYPLESVFLMLVLSAVILCLIITLVYLRANDFILKKSFSPVLISVYVVFCVTTLSVGFFIGHPA